MALMPVGFGLQQALEGVVWLGLNHGPAAQLLKGEALAYLFFAMTFWPIWIPYLALRLWPQHWHKHARQLLQILQGVGLLLGIWLWLPLLLQPTRIEPVVVKGSIDYGLTLLMSDGLADSIRYLYAAVVAIPLLLLPYPWLRSFGVALLASGLVAELAYRQAFVSVWCYFSALLSVLIVWIVYTNKIRTRGRPKEAS